MNIGGVNTLACLCSIEEAGTTKIYPLPHMYVLKDLVPDMTNFYDALKEIKPYLQNDGVEKPESGEWLQSKEDRKKLDGMYEVCCVTLC